MPRAVLAAPRSGLAVRATHLPVRAGHRSGPAVPAAHIPVRAAHRSRLAGGRPGRAVRAAPLLFLAAAAFVTLPSLVAAQADERPRARDLGMAVGIFPTGTHNAITDVTGVRVGQTTVREGDDVRTGVTAILPHAGNPYLSRVPAAIHVGNGFGKLVGVTQVRELGELETPVLLTCTLCVWKAADAMVEWMLAREGMENVRSLNAVVGETNDGGLNDIRARPIDAAHVVAALDGADDGPVEEGAVGAGTGTSAFGWKGGIGSSSRVLPASLGGYTVGVLVQSNFGGILTMGGAPVGRELGRYSFQGQVGGGGAGGAGGASTGVEAAGVDAGGGAAGGQAAGSTNGARETLGQADTPPAASWTPETDVQEWGSIMIVVATDAPLSARNLERVASRAIMGLARTGSYASNGSGDYVIAFSTASEVRRGGSADVIRVEDLANDRMSGLFQATVEATEEAIYNSLLKATTVTGNGRTVEALPLDATVEILRRYRVIPPAEASR